MIACLRGKLLEKNPEYAVVDVSGVGYRVFITFNSYETLPMEGEDVRFHTVTISREDALHLYGFTDREEMDMFKKLITVTRIGPRLASSILSGTKADDLKDAISRQDKGRISRFPGVGPKTAERIVLELKEKFGPAIPEKGAPAGSERVFADAVAALLNLGYRKQQAEKAAAGVLEEHKEADIADVIRRSLKILSS